MAFQRGAFQLGAFQMVPLAIALEPSPPVHTTDLWFWSEREVRVPIRAVGIGQLRAGAALVRGRGRVLMVRRGALALSASAATVRGSAAADRDVECEELWMLDEV